MSRYAKAIFAAIGSAATVIAGALPDDSIAGIIAAAIVAACTAITVYAVPNRP